MTDDGRAVWSWVRSGGGGKRQAVADRKQIDGWQGRRAVATWFLYLAAALGIVVAFVVLASVTSSTIALIVSVLVGLGVGFSLRRGARG